MKLTRQIQYIRNLDTVDRRQLRAFTEGDDLDLNQMLCRNTPLSGHYRNLYMLLMDIFDNIPTTSESITVYRGIEATELDQSRLKCQFVSTTLDKSVAVEKFSGSDCCLLRITIPAGSHILPMMVASHQPDEAEILLPPGGIWTVTNVLKERLTIYDLTYLPKNSLEIKSVDQLPQAKEILDEEKNLERIINIFDINEVGLLYDSIEEQIDAIIRDMKLYPINRDEVIQKITSIYS